MKMTIASPLRLRLLMYTFSMPSLPGPSAQFACITHKIGHCAILTLHASLTCGVTSPPDQHVAQVAQVVEWHKGASACFTSIHQMRDPEGGVVMAGLLTSPEPGPVRR